jgi:hypothetical protein
LAALSLFGFSFRKKDPENVSFAPPVKDDGATIVTAPVVGSAYGTYLDLQGAVRSEAELITKYRQMSLHSEIRSAIDHITNEAIVVEKENPIVKMDLDEVDGLPPKLANVIEEEFKNVLRLLDFNASAYEIFKRWYVDGRLPYHVIIDKKAPQDGIKELRYIDPRKIKKVREVKQVKDPQTGAVMQQTIVEYYIYNDQGFNAKPAAPYGATTATEINLKIAKDAVVYATSGVLNENGTTVLSHLHDSIIPLNKLRSIEDAAVIYRLVRAPERRVWYIDVGDLPKAKAEQYIQEMMNKYRNKMVYDSATGTVKDDRKHMTMLEDIWLSRRGGDSGGRGTQIDTLPGGENLGQMEEINYFLRQLYKSLKVPLSRLDPDITVTLGRATEITRDELDFSKFIDRLRLRFNQLFNDILEKQLVLKGIMLPEEWRELTREITYVYARDNYFSELKDQEILIGRMNVLQGILPVVGRFVSNQWVRERIMHQTEEEMEIIDQQILEERENPIYAVQTMLDGTPAIPMTDPGLTLPPGLPPPEVLNSMYPQPDKKKGGPKK